MHFEINSGFFYSCELQYFILIFYENILCKQYDNGVSKRNDKKNGGNTQAFKTNYIMILHSR